MAIQKGGDRMAKLTRVGDAVVIKTIITLQEFKIVQALVPSALSYRDPETKELVFSIASNSHDAASSKGIVFNEKGYVTIGTTAKMDETGLEFGRELMYLNIIERQVKDVLKTADIKNIEDDIEIIEV